MRDQNKKERKIIGNSGLLVMGNNMKIKLKKSNIREGKWYSGVIVNHSVTASKLRIFAELDEELGVTYMYVIPIETSSNSRLANFAREMEILDENGDIDTELLDELAVKVKLKRVEDGNLYISNMIIDEEFYQQEEDEEDE